VSRDCDQCRICVMKREECVYARNWTLRKNNSTQSVCGLLGCAVKEVERSGTFRAVHSVPTHTPAGLVMCMCCLPLSTQKAQRQRGRRRTISWGEQMPKIDNRLQSRPFSFPFSCLTDCATMYTRPVVSMMLASHAARQSFLEK
jgi:hypothetical protein